MRVTYVTVQPDRVTMSTNAPVTVAARNIDSACPTSQSQPAYNDVPGGSTHARPIGCMSAWQVTTGTSATTYGPAAPVTREQMASFIARLVDASDADLPSAPPDRFGDDETSGHEANINRLAAAGIVSGDAQGNYNPRGVVVRGQMATFLTRAAAFVLGQALAGGADAFGDDATSVHHASINAAAGAGIATGTGPGAFSPDAGVSRAQMAGFLARLADVVVDDGKARPPA